MTDEIETDKWRIISKNSLHDDLDESYVELVLRLKSDLSGLRMIKKEDLELDLKDLGKWRHFKKLKKELEN